MKKLILTMTIAALAATSFTSCKKDAKPVDENAISESELAEIRAQGFGTGNVQRADGGYIVEGDIFISKEQLKENPSSPNMIIAQEEQYRTFNLVNPTNYPTIRV